MMVTIGSTDSSISLGGTDTAIVGLTDLDLTKQKVIKQFLIQLVHQHLLSAHHNYNVYRSGNLTVSGTTTLLTLQLFNMMIISLN